MFSFGKQKVRSLDTFGVSGLLSENSDVFYNAIFSPKHLGKVSDLLAARLRKGGINEIRLRILLLLTGFQGYRGQLKKRRGIRLFSRDVDELLEQAVILECGIDKEKIAVGVCFTLSKTLTVKTDGIADRVFKKTPKDNFEEMLVELQNHADRIVLKYQPSTRKFEIIAVLGIEGKMDFMALQSKQPPELIIIEQSNVQQAPKPRAYINLGDLDYLKLLREGAKEKEVNQSSTGVFLMPGAEIDSSEEVPVIKKDPAPPEPEKAEDDQQLRLKKLLEDSRKRTSRFQKQGQKVVLPDRARIKGDGEDLMDQDVAVVAEDGANDSDVGDEEIESFSKYEPKSDEVSIKSIFSSAKSAIKRFLDRFMFSSSSKVMDDSMTIVSGGDLLGEQEETLDFEALIAAGETGNPEIQSRKLMIEFESGSIGRRIAKSERDLKGLMREIKSPKVRNWVEALIGGFSEERVQLHDLAKKLNRSVRLKEYESNQKIARLQDELKRKESQLFIKNGALTSTREQLVQMTSNFERAKATSQTSTEDAHFKQKYSLTHRLLVHAKEENVQMMRKIEELKSQVASLQNQKNQGGNTVEYSTLLSKYEKLYRQAEEFKKANRQLMDRLSDPKRDKSHASAGNEELRKRLEAAMKIIAEKEKESETSKGRVLALQKQEVRLKVELNKAIAELKKIKEGGKNTPPEGSGGGGSPPKVA